MTISGTVVWVGKSGEKYIYTIYTIGASFNEVPGNYVFAKKTIENTFTPIYIGETEDLSERFDNHHKMPCIKRNLASHITVHKSSPSAATRKAEEQDLIDNYDKVCNG